MTMTFLALEVTGDFPIASLVLVAVIASSLTVRKTFGYSFATWRFHLRGESIRSAHDVGWIRSLTVGQLMRRDVRTVRADTTLAAFRRAFPLGSATQVVAVDETGLYAGIVLVAEAHAAPIDDKAAATRVADLVRYTDEVLLPQMNAKEAVALFDKAESEALAVVESRQAARVIGLLSEKHTLKRYSEELDRQRRASVGEVA
jgi:CIC family chloride channel protein